MTVYPSILTINNVVAQTQLLMANAFPGCETVQIDVIDGWFADNLTLSPLDMPDLEMGDIKVDMHLMVEEPLDFVYELVSVKESVPVRSVIVQVEHVSGLTSVIEEIRQQGWQAGVSINIGTDPEELVDELISVLPDIKVWQVMGVPAGFQGQQFKPIALETLKFLRETIGDVNQVEVLVDGGVTPALIPSLAKIGATGVVVGSTLWKNPDPAKQWDVLTSTSTS